MNGAIPSEIGQLKDLRKLLLLNNNFTGAIPTEIGLIKSLEVLDLRE